MDKLNTYQKVQIILLVSIVIALIVFIISIVKTKNIKNYATEETFSEMTSVINEEPEEVLVGEKKEEDEDTSWDEEAEDSQIDLEKEENSEENNSAKYYLKVNYTANVVTAYTKDSSGQYTVAAKAMVCSTGKATPTSGVYKMSDKYRWHQLNGGVYGQYCSRITGHILFHSVPYATNSPDSLKYTAYDKLGTKASAGCIRLTVEDAMWIYSNCASGTYVEFYSSSNPGPLGKPTAQKISSNEKCRNWDPTDPISKNPWHTYVEPASTKVEEPKREVENNNQSEVVNNPEENTSNENENESNNNNNSDNNNNQNNNSGNNTNNNEQKPDEENNDTSSANLNDNTVQEDITDDGINKENTN